LVSTIVAVIVVRWLSKLPRYAMPAGVTKTDVPNMEVN
jgi:hypothetical protein